MDAAIFQYILPSNLLDNFEIIKVQEESDPLINRQVICIYLDEKNILPSGFSESDYESKGFLPAKRIQDFPLRGKAVYLMIRTRRWRHKEHLNELIWNDFSFIAEGSRLTEELSAFLKGTGRDPRRYH